MISPSPLYKILFCATCPMTPAFGPPHVWGAMFGATTPGAPVFGNRRISGRLPHTPIATEHSMTHLGVGRKQLPDLASSEKSS